MELNYSYNNRADYLPNNTINIIEEDPHVKNIDEFLSEPIDFFSLIFSNNLYEELAKEALLYYEGTIEEKYGKNWKEREAASNSYLYYYKKYNITKEDIKILFGALIFFGLHPYNCYDNYWKDDIIYENSLSKVTTKNKFKFLCHCLHLPIDNNDLNCSNDDNQNDDIIDLEYSEREAKLKYYEQKIDPRIKVKEYLEQIIMNSKNYFILGKNIK